MKTSHAKKCLRSVIKENYTASRSVVHKREMVFVGQDPTSSSQCCIHVLRKISLDIELSHSLNVCNNCYRKQWCILYCMFQGVERSLHGMSVLEPYCGSPNTLQLPAANKAWTRSLCSHNHQCSNTQLEVYLLTTTQEIVFCMLHFHRWSDLNFGSIGTCCCKGCFNECDKQQKYNSILHLSQLHTFSWNS